MPGSAQQLGLQFRFKSMDGFRNGRLRHAERSGGRPQAPAIDGSEQCFDLSQAHVT